MRSQIETFDKTTKTTEAIEYSADENISSQTTTIQNLEIENEQNIFAKIKQKFTKVSAEQNFADYINSETNGGNISETIKFYNDHGLCKCDLTTYKPFVEKSEFTTQYQMPGVTYLSQAPNHSWNMSLIERKTEQPLPENNVENYLTTPTMDDNETYPSINHISSNINGKMKNQTIVYGNELLFGESVSETTNYILNGQNNVIHEKVNNKIIDYEYDAYGQQLSTSKTPTFGFNTEYQINNSTQYLRARTYDNSTGRMMQYDTYQGGLNPLSRNHYTYAHNNPVNLEDPSGNCAGICGTIITISLITGKTILKKIYKPILYTETEYIIKEEVKRYRYTYESKKQREMFGYHYQMQEEIRIHSTTLHMLYRELGISYSIIYERKNMHNTLAVEYRNIFVGTKEEQRKGESNAKKQMQYELNDLINLLYEKNSDQNFLNGSNNNKSPSPKEETYSVPKYVSHGNNETKYK